MDIKIGVDIIDVKRIEKALQKHGKKFILRILRESEIQELQSISHKSNFSAKLAARFAAKEAVSKAIGTGIGAKLSFQDIELYKDNNGSPQVKILTTAFNHQTQKIQISISHEKETVVAFAIVYTWQ